jgi:hypothetical protein
MKPAGKFIFRFSLGGFIALSIAACVGQVEIDYAPCPCPEGYQCCQSLNDGCLSADQECPDQYPASSRASCVVGRQCPYGESCHVWKAPDGQPAGPGECRRLCPHDYACDGSDICRLSVHDGASLTALNITRLCLSDPAEPGCENLECLECESSQLSKTFCDGNLVRGCFFALDQRCGLTCRSTVIVDCGPTGCLPIEGGAKCAEYGWGEWCDDYSCSLCGSPENINSLFCDGDSIAMCSSIDLVDEHCPGAGCDCDQICMTQPLVSCANGCSQEGGAHCLP